MFPEDDVRLDLLPDDAVTRHEGGLIEIGFGYPDEWLEEDEELIGHARDPFKRIDCRRTSRHVRVSIGGEVVAETRRAVALSPRSPSPPASASFDTDLVQRLVRLNQ